MYLGYRSPLGGSLSGTGVMASPVAKFCQRDVSSHFPDLSTARGLTRSNSLRGGTSREGFPRCTMDETNMFKAMKSRKVRLREGLEEFRYADVFKLNEDFLTAAVFSRLLYLTSEALSSLLLRGLEVNLGPLKEAAFWPAWSVESKSGETIRVEPDLYVQFEDRDVIVEAKLNDNPGCHAPEQWSREWAAWYKGEHSQREKQAVLLAIGGLGATNVMSEAEATRIGIAANRLLQTDFPGVPSIQWVGLSWQELYDGLGSEILVELNSQLAHDLTEILRYFGLRRYEFLNDLSKPKWQSTRAINDESFGVVSRWHNRQRAPDWLEVSRLSRPISSSSVFSVINRFLPEAEHDAG
jgi:hypothetical protein